MWKCEVLSAVCISGYQSLLIVNIRFCLLKYNYKCLALELRNNAVDAWWYLSGKLTFTINSYRARHRHAWTRCSEVLPSAHGRGGR